MSRESLQVSTAYLRELAARHGRAATDITSAVAAVSGVDNGIRTSHGSVAWSTASAVQAVQQARRDAGDSAANQSHSLSGNLTAAAVRYEATDLESGVRLDERLG